MAMSVEEVRTRFEALENRVLELQQGSATATQRVQTAEAEHQRLHAELERTRTLASAPRSDFKLIDPKSMIPEKFGTKAGPTWLDWSEGTRAYVEMLDVHLAKALKHVENHEAPLTAEEVDPADVAVQAQEIFKAAYRRECQDDNQIRSGLRHTCPRTMEAVELGARSNRTGHRAPRVT